MKKLALGMAALGIVAIWLSSSSALAGEPDLRWRFQKGQALKYVLKHREVRTAELADQKFETTTQSEYGWRWTVHEVAADGTATLHKKWTSLRVQCNAANFEFSYDSTQSARPPDDYRKRLANLFDQILYAGEYQLRLAPNGQLHDLKGLNKVLDENNPGMNILDFHALHLRDGTFAWFLRQALGQLPEDKKQQKWTVDAKANLSDVGPVTGQVVFVRKGTAKSADRVCEHIAFSGRHTAELDMKWLNVAVKGPLRTTQFQGELWFDARAGVLARGTADIDLAGDLKFGDNATVMKLRFHHQLELELQP